MSAGPIERIRLDATTSTNPAIFLLDEQGKFRAGNGGGPGNPYVRRVAALRGALFAEVTAEDLRRVVRRLIELAAAGDVAAAKVLLERVLGRMTPDALLFLSPQTAEGEGEFCADDRFL